MLSIKNRLRKKKEFSFIYKKGETYHTKYLTLYCYKTKYNFCKVGFSVSKKIGDSVTRHKVKRRLSEIVRLSIKNFPINNYIFVSKNGIESLDYNALKEQVEQVISKVKTDEGK